MLTIYLILLLTKQKTILDIFPLKEKSMNYKYVFVNKQPWQQRCLFFKID